MHRNSRRSAGRLPIRDLVWRSRGNKPKNLLDAGPPIITAPSATLLMNSTVEPKTGMWDFYRKSPEEKALLSVADPNYGAPSEGSAPAPVDLSAGSRYGALRGDLSSSPFTAWECTWVAETFRKAGLDAACYKKPMLAKPRSECMLRDEDTCTSLATAWLTRVMATCLDAGANSWSSSADPTHDGFYWLKIDQ